MDANVGANPVPADAHSESSPGLIERAVDSVVNLVVPPKPSDSQSGTSKNDPHSDCDRNSFAHFVTELALTVPLFMRGRKARLVAAALNGINDIHTNDGAGGITADASLGFARGYLQQEIMERMGARPWAAPVKGVVIGEANRFVGGVFNAQTYRDRLTGQVDLTSIGNGTADIFAQMTNLNSIASDATIFGLAHVTSKGANALTRGALERSPLAMNMFSGGTMGLLNGAHGEIVNQMHQGGPLDFRQIAQAAIFEGTTQTLAGAGGFGAERFWGRTGSIMLPNSDSTIGPPAVRRQAGNDSNPLLYEAISSDLIPGTPYVSRLLTPEGVHSQHVFGAKIFRPESSLTEVWDCPDSRLKITDDQTEVAFHVETYNGSRFAVDPVNGRVTVEHTGDGDQLSVGENNEVTINRNDGVKVKYSLSGTKIELPNGNEISYDTEHSTRTRIFPDGTTVSERVDQEPAFKATYPDESTEIRTRGTRTVVLKSKDGTTEAQFSDGSLELTDKTGRTSILPDGRRIRQYKSGQAANIEHADGSSETRSDSQPYSKVKIPLMVPEEFKRPPLTFSGVSDRFIAHQHMAFGEMSEGVYNALIVHGFQIRIVDKAINELPYQRHMVKPRGYSEGLTFEQTGGFAQPWQRIAVVAEQTRDSETFDWSSENARDAEGTMGHEVGHCLDLILGEDGKHFSESEEFMEAYKRDLASPAMERVRSKVGYYLQKGTAGPSEALAEASAVLITIHSDPDFEAAFPNVIDLMRRKIDELDDAPPANSYRIADMLSDASKVDPDEMLFLNEFTTHNPELLANLDASFTEEHVDAMLERLPNKKERSALAAMLGRRFREDPTAVSWLTRAAKERRNPLKPIALEALAVSETEPD